MSDATLDTATRAVHRWLTLGRDVVVRGDHGSGRSSLLELVRRLPHRRADTVLLRAAGPTPFATLRAHGSLPTRRGQPWSEPELAEWLSAELGSEGALLLVDDVEHVDEGTLSVVRRVLAQGGSDLVVTTTADLAREADPGLARLVGERAPAEVLLPPFGHTELHALARTVLGGAVDAALVAELVTVSAGNPRVATLVLQSARWAGAVGRSDDRWTVTSPLRDVPGDPVAHLLTARLPHHHVDALELVAWLGTPDHDTVARLVPPATVDALTSRRRLLGFTDGEGVSRYAVSPPALAHALRGRLRPERRRRLAHLAGEPATAAAVVPVTPLELGEDVAVPLVRRGTELPQRSPEVAGALQEHERSRENALLDAWHDDPGVVTANALLDVLGRRPAHDLAREVVAGTRLRADDDPAARAVLRATELRWLVWSGAGPGDRAAFLAEHADELGPLAAAFQVHDEVAAAVRSGADDTTLLGPPAPAVLAGPAGAGVAARVAVARAAALLRSGRPDLALRLCRSTVLATPPPGEARHHRDAVASVATVLLGRLDEAEARARRGLAAAYARADVLGVRVHACLLAEVLVWSDRGAAAWRTLTGALRLGPAGPVGTTFHRRALSIAAILRVSTGDVDTAQSMMATLDAAPRADRPVVGSLSALARAAVDEVTGPGPVDALWERGLRYAQEGLRQPALLCWSFSTATYTPEQLAVVRDAYDAAPLPLLEPYLRLHEARTARDVAAVVERLHALPADLGGRFRHAMGHLDGVALPDHRPPARVVLRAEARLTTLSPREREVATLAREGMSNRDIAGELGLSVRTVENHMSAVLRKLGFARRSDLSWWNATGVVATAPGGPGRPARARTG
ncbi:LuxR family transcriptional regulator [Cellulomonas sp. C5510]|uniref:LuxR family transcriptional regulator n=1 Tax=Cellulomonas sp. C5510 TaxID=2871170 RepID=UPI001C9442E1|nr:LuxR family transcriptional regulator [Cellulomonas sp. C5510]QZN85338.1 LuxR C-terminal-related transcriptional regulator [Cellulomonas sp. C5510]